MIEYSDLLKAAAENISNSEEIYLRTSAHQGYYAFYHCALDLAAKNGFTYNPKEKGGVHAQLSNFYHKSCDKNKKAIGRSLKNCHFVRVSADYELDKDIVKVDILAHLRACNESVKDLNRIDTPKCIEN